MGPLSMDLRTRIVTAYENAEGSQEQLARRFSVSRAVVGKLVRQKRSLGTLQPQTHRRGRKPAITGEAERRLRQHLVDRPDATLVERREELGLECAVKTVWLTIRRWKSRFKKSR